MKAGRATNSKKATVPPVKKEGASPKKAPPQKKAKPAKPGIAGYTRPVYRALDNFTVFKLWPNGRICAVRRMDLLGTTLDIVVGTALVLPGWESGRAVKKAIYDTALKQAQNLLKKLK